VNDDDKRRDQQFPLGFEDTTPRLGKSDAAFRTISEVATDIGVPQHVLRFWESKFSQVRPLKRGGGRRYYRPEDIATLRRIKSLLYDDGMTIRGVQKVLRDPSQRAEPETAEVVEADSHGPSTDDLRQLLAELTALRDDLHDALQDA
jgi:DNA-binding transcriptional MerR regulator